MNKLGQNLALVAALSASAGGCLTEFPAAALERRGADANLVRDRSNRFADAYASVIDGGMDMGSNDATPLDAGFDVVTIDADTIPRDRGVDHPDAGADGSFDEGVVDYAGGDQGSFVEDSGADALIDQGTVPGDGEAVVDGGADGSLDAESDSSIDSGLDAETIPEDAAPDQGTDSAVIIVGDAGVDAGEDANSGPSFSDICPVDTLAVDCRVINNTANVIEVQTGPPVATSHLPSAGSITVTYPCQELTPPNQRGIWVGGGLVNCVEINQAVQIVTCPLAGNDEAPNFPVKLDHCETFDAESAGMVHSIGNRTLFIVRAVLPQ